MENYRITAIVPKRELNDVKVVKMLQDHAETENEGSQGLESY